MRMARWRVHRPGEVVRMNYLTDKVAAYANALDTDIGTVPFKQVRDSRLWVGYSGTIHGCMIGTEKGFAFPTPREALDNAYLMREQCREIVEKRKAKP